MGFLQLVSLVIFITLSSNAFCRTQLNGSATYLDLGREVFVGSLYLEYPTEDNNEIINSDEHIQLKVVILDVISKRRWINIWMQSIAINNPGEGFEKQAENLIDVFDKIQGPLQKNDVFEINYSPGNGTLITLNSVPLVNNPDKDLLRLFLLAWLGPVPPSTQFKEMILGKGNYQQVSDKLPKGEPSTARILTIQQWLVRDESAITQDAEEEPDQIKEPKHPSNETDNLSVPVGSNQKLPETRLAEADSGEASAEITFTEETSSETTSPEVTSLETTGVEATSPEKVIPVNQVDKPIAPQQVATVTQTQEETLPAPQKPPENKPVPLVEAGDFEEDSASKLSVESVLAQREYTTQVLRNIYQQIIYPRRAVSRNIEGSVRITVYIARSGDIISVEIAESSGYSILDEAALLAVDKVGKFAPAPDSITDSTQEISIPISFRLR